MLTRAGVEEVLSAATRIEFANGSYIKLQDGNWWLFSSGGGGIEFGSTLGELLQRIAEHHKYE